VALVSLTILSPQPSSGGVQPTLRTYGTSGKVHQMALHGEMVWGVLEDETEYDTILDFFGLASVLDAPVTVYLRNELFVYTRYNATAVRPELGRDAGWNFFPRGVTILLKNLVAI
jgi:hypothetical protein